MPPAPPSPSTSRPRQALPGRSLRLLLVLGLLGVLVVGSGGPEALLLRLGFAPSAIGLAQAATPAARVETAQGSLAVFFTTPELVYPDRQDGRIAPSAERALLADLERARQSIELASFEYNLASLATSLRRARARGVAVRLALDRDCLENPLMARWAGWLEEAGIAISWQQGHAFLHSKFVVIDRRVVWTGSWNPTINDTYRNNNNLLRISLPQVVANYAAEFERMAGGAFGTAKRGPTPFPQAALGPGSIATYFAPVEPVREHVLAAIAEARHSIDMLAFSFTDDALGAALRDRHNAGVAVRVVMERRNAGGIGSEFAQLRAAGIVALEDGNCYTMHHKVLIIDGRLVITGSYNFTARAEEVNDENALIIASPTLAHAYQVEFERIYRQAQAPLRCQ